MGLAALLLPACTVPGDAAWSDLHGSASVAGYAHSFKMSGTGITVEDSSGSGSDFSGDLDLEDNTENVLYSAKPMRPATDETFTIDPPPAFRSSGIACCMQRK